MKKQFFILSLTLCGIFQLNHCYSQDDVLTVAQMEEVGHFAALPTGYQRLGQDITGYSEVLLYYPDGYENTEDAVWEAYIFEDPTALENNRHKCNKVARMGDGPDPNSNVVTCYCNGSGTSCRKGIFGRITFCSL